MARPRGSGSANTFESLLITTLGQLSHDTIGRSLVGFIVMLCVWTFFVHWGLVFPSIWRVNRLLATFGTAFHQALHGLLLYSLYRAVKEDPGFVPRPHGTSPGQPGEAGFCDKCAHRRPDRAHHCKVCRRCIKKMDHHCLFVNNCVGVYNYKFFVLLLLYTILGGFYNAGLSYVWAKMRKGPSDNVLDFSRGMVVANGCTICMISTILVPLCGYHIYLACNNTTTLEALKGKTGHYDLGSPLRNLKHGTRRYGPSVLDESLTRHVLFLFLHYRHICDIIQAHWQTFGSRPLLWLSPFHNDITAEAPLLDVA